MERQRYSFHSKQLMVATQNSLLEWHYDVVTGKQKTRGEHDIKSCISNSVT